MAGFKGFPDGKNHQTPVPSAFFKELLPAIDDLGELKLVLHVFWRLEQQEGAFHLLTRADLEGDALLRQSLPGEALEQALERATQRGTLLAGVATTGDRQETCYFLNSPRGRAALRAIQAGQWRPFSPSPAAPAQEPPNIFKLYEENIGPLTPMIAETLGEAQDTYPAQWIEDAIRIAVEKNKRSWRYAAAILERWQQEGRHGRQENPQDRPDSAESRRRYVEGEFSEFVEH